MTVPRKSKSSANSDQPLYPYHFITISLDGDLTSSSAPNLIKLMQEETANAVVVIIMSCYIPCLLQIRSFANALLIKMLLKKMQYSKKFISFSSNAKIKHLGSFQRFLSRKHSSTSSHLKKWFFCLFCVKETLDEMRRGCVLCKISLRSWFRGKASTES